MIAEYTSNESNRMMTYTSKLPTMPITVLHLQFGIHCQKQFLNSF